MTDAAAKAEPEIKVQGKKKRFMRLHTGMVVGLLGITLFIGVGILSRFWLPGGLESMRVIDVSSKFLPPLSPGHLLGTDNLGRDILGQLMRATSNTLAVVFSGTALAVCIGVAIGVLSTTLRSGAEQIVMRSVDVIYAIPAVLLALVLAAKLGPSLGTTIIALGLWFFPLIARVTRSAALGVRERAFIKAARTYGRGELFIAWRHILPNVISIILVQVTLVMALGIIVEASLAFLGVGAQPPEPSWGRMLKESQNYMGEDPWLAIIPGLAIVLAVLSFNLVGNGLRDLLDRRGSREGQ